MLCLLCVRAYRHVHEVLPVALVNPLAHLPHAHSQVAVATDFIEFEVEAPASSGAVTVAPAPTDSTSATFDTATSGRSSGTTKLVAGLAVAAAAIAAAVIFGGSGARAAPATAKKQAEAKKAFW